VLIACDAQTPIPTTSLPQTAAAPAADDIVGTPGGLAYRANIKGPPDTFATITTETKELSGITIRYRASIETKAGENRNNIFQISLPADRSAKDNTLDFYDKGLPEGISVAIAQSFTSPNRIEAVLVFTIAPNVAPGKYSFDIGIKLNGRDLGTLDCIITVIG
jgi:hypothetical protein